YLDALAVDPEHVEAGERVAELLWQAERYQDLGPVLEMLTRKEAEPNVQVERLLRLAPAAQAPGFSDQDHQAVTRAAELDPTNLKAQRGRAELLLQKGEYLAARGALEKVFVHHLEDLPPSERVELFFQLGGSELKLHRKSEARGWLHKALEIDPT